MADKLTPARINKFCPDGTVPFDNTGESSSNPDDLQQGDYNADGYSAGQYLHSNQLDTVGLCATHGVKQIMQSGVAPWVSGEYHPIGALVLHGPQVYRAEVELVSETQQAAEPGTPSAVGLWKEYIPDAYSSAATLPWDEDTTTPTTKDKHNQDIGNLQQVIAGRYGDNIPMEQGGQTIKQVVDGITPGPGQEVNSDHVLMSPVDPDNPKTLTEYRDKLNTDEMVVAGAEANLLLTTELNRLRSVTQNAPFITGKVADQVLAIDFTDLSLPA